MLRLKGVIYWRRNFNNKLKNMNYFAGSITFTWNITLSFKDRTFNFVKNMTKDNNSSVFFFWETTKKTSSELLEFLKKIVSEDVISYDLSISTEDKIEILEDEQIDWEYNVMSISWINTSFEDILDNFWEGEEVISIREAEDSKAFWNKVIKVDVISC